MLMNQFIQVPSVGYYLAPKESKAQLWGLKTSTGGQTPNWWLNLSNPGNSHTGVCVIEQLGVTKNHSVLLSLHFMYNGELFYSKLIIIAHSTSLICGELVGNKSYYNSMSRYYEFVASF